MCSARIVTVRAVQLLKRDVVVPAVDPGDGASVARTLLPAACGNIRFLGHTLAHLVRTGVTQP